MGACQSFATNLEDSSAWLYIPVPYRLAQLVHQWGVIVVPPDALLETKPDYCDTRPMPRDMHVTLAVNLDPHKKLALEHAIRTSSRFRMYFGSVSSWVSREREVVKLDMSSDGLCQLHDKILTALCAHGPAMCPFSPHITMAFCKPGLDIARSSLFTMGKHEMASSNTGGWVVGHVVYEHDGKKEIWELK